MALGCPFITCAVKRNGIEFCWKCKEKETCKKWDHHRKFSHFHDTFTCYQKLEDNIMAIELHGIKIFDKEQIIRENLLNEMIQGFNEGRSKRYYCIAATVMTIEEMKNAIHKSLQLSSNSDIKMKAKKLHEALDEIAKQKNYMLKLRKYKKK
jgi:hypothetical protein